MAYTFLADKTQVVDLFILVWIFLVDEGNFKTYNPDSPSVLSITSTFQSTNPFNHVPTINFSSLEIFEVKQKILGGSLL